MRNYLIASSLPGLLLVCVAMVSGAQQLPTPPPPAPADAYYPEKQPAAPFNPALPSIFLVGDSTASYHPDRMHEGAAAVQGWGVFATAFFDPTKVNFVNVARGGRSTRTYMSEGLWAEVLKQLKPGDLVLLQLGQNDIFPVNDRVARGTIPGVDDEVQDILNQSTGKRESVHTFGWYLRRYIDDTLAKHAKPIVLSLTTRDVWKEGKVEIGVNRYREDSYRVAQSVGHVDFVDASAIIAAQYEKLGKEKTFGLFHANEPVHINTTGAFLDARLIVAGLKGLADKPVDPFLSYLGQQVSLVTVSAPVEWSNPRLADTPNAPTQDTERSGR